MKTKKFKTEYLGHEAEIKFSSYESNQEKQKKVHIEICRSFVVVSLYKLWKIRDWIDAAINQIEDDEVKRELAKNQIINQTGKLKRSL